MKYIFSIGLSLFAFLASPLSAQYEADYVRMLAGHFGGETEVRVPNGRVDIQTDQYAIEVEFAYKWKNSIGQALWYALQSNRTPGIVLVLKERSDYRHAVQLNSALTYAGLDDRIRVWIYPNDFPGLDIQQATTQYQQQSLLRRSDAAVTDYWLNTNSHKRHKRGCQNFGTTSKGRYCGPTEGQPAGCCH